MSEQADAKERAISAQERSELSKLLVGRTITAIGWLLGVTFLLLACTFIVVVWTTDKDPTKTASLLEKSIGVFDKVISSFFPLVGAWVGAVVAFYFARDNFISATQSAETLLSHTRRPPNPSQTLVSDKMTAIDKAFKQSGNVTELKALKIGPLLEEMKQAGVGRLVLLDAGKPYAVLHASSIEKVIKDKAIEPGSATLDVILSDDNFASLLSSTFALVKSSATLADANSALTAQAAQLRGSAIGCSDVLVTPTGKADEQVVGYLTNDDIRKAMTPGS